MHTPDKPEGLRYTHREHQPGDAEFNGEFRSERSFDDRFISIEYMYTAVNNYTERRKRKRRNLVDHTNEDPSISTD